MFSLVLFSYPNVHRNDDVTSRKVLLSHDPVLVSRQCGLPVDNNSTRGVHYRSVSFTLLVTE